MKIRSKSIEDAIKKGCLFINKFGKTFYDEHIKLKECLNLFFEILIDHFEDPKIENDIHQWMNDNFNYIKRVPELNNCRSYGWRLYNYKGANQIKWIINKLKNKPETKSATITMLKRAGGEAYIPCVSMFDFKIRNKILIENVICRSLDFGKKALYNFYNIAKIGFDIKEELKLSKLKLMIYVLSAHIYEDDL